MDTSDIKKIKIHYRSAKLNGNEAFSGTLQDQLAEVMKSSLGQDTRERVLPMAEDLQHKGCLNFHESEKQFFVADIMHLDGRTTLPKWIHPKEPRPYAEIVPQEVPDGEASLGEPVYILVAGNHVASIERLGFRNTNLAKYINALLDKSGQLKKGTEWRLLPKIEITGDKWKGGGVKKVIVKPYAAVIGDAPSQAPQDVGRKKAKVAASALEGLIMQGQRVIDALVSFGADETKLDKLREAMSVDLILKAKLELSVASVKRKTVAEISIDAIQQALAELAQDGEVIIVSEDGRSNGKLVQLVHTAEVVETGGLIVWGRAKQAMSSAMSAWAAKGAIELVD